jgi:uncharacterized protein
MNSFSNFPINLSELPDIETQRFNSLQPRFRWVLIINSSLFFLFLFLGAFAFYYFSPQGMPGFLHPVIFSTIGFFFVIRLVLILLGFPKRGWMVREHDILFRKGLLRYKLVAVPLNRIQHSEIRQSFLARLLKISKVKVYTAGGNASDLNIAGLSESEALKLKDFLSKTVSQYE